jgi:hypothetical protein
MDELLAAVAALRQDMIAIPGIREASDAEVILRMRDLLASSRKAHREALLRNAALKEKHAADIALVVAERNALVARHEPRPPVPNEP